MTHFDWYNYYEVAERLSEYDDEGSLRSAISRYYYFAFCSARYYLVETKNLYKFKYSKGGTHQKLYEHLQNHGNDNEAALGDLLETLFEKRNCADYDWVDNEISIYLLEEDNCFVQSEKCLASHVLKQIVDNHGNVVSEEIKPIYL